MFYSLREEGHGFCIQMACEPTLQGLWAVHVRELEARKPLVAHEHVGLLRSQWTCGHNSRFQHFSWNFVTCTLCRKHVETDHVDCCLHLNSPMGTARE